MNRKTTYLSLLPAIHISSMRKAGKCISGKSGIRLLKAACLAALVLISSGCANMGVKPWERDLLAKSEMSLSYPSTELGLDDHIYFSKEATSGGRSFAGGGCGCN
ncbi:DUF4266 domain-containing protein [Aliikangiella sp. G2MR2-5]|uniref:DUF4266 domain-containing protein n=1 Tax=Aliikangiella sp. G2MR2-5 TaxID=2788943 RepID=UPI001FEEF911|nr:DUF4266 domain-containing protein [Aliikangiella sp. G2MR2-5]